MQLPMDIFSLGHASFKLRGKKATVVTDPYNSDTVGIKFPKNVEANILTVSHEHPDHNDVHAVSGEPYVVRGPGEYEINGVSIIGISTFHDAEGGAVRGKNTAYRIEIDGVRIAHLGDVGHVLTSAQLDALDGIDILFLPVGGEMTVDAKAAAAIVADMEPKIVIPMHYATEKLDPTFAAKLSPVALFLKEIGKEGIVPVTKLSVSKDKIPLEMQVVLFE